MRHCCKKIHHHYLPHVSVTTKTLLITCFVQIDNSAEARKLGYYLFWLLKGDLNSLEVTDKDLDRVFPNSASQKAAAWRMLDEDGNGAVALHELVARIVKIYKCAYLQWFFYSRNTAYVTPKIHYYHDLNVKFSLDRSIQKNVRFSFENRSTGLPVNLLSKLYVRSYQHVSYDTVINAFVLEPE